MVSIQIRFWRVKRIEEDGLPHTYHRFTAVGNMWIRSISTLPFTDYVYKVIWFRLCNSSLAYDDFSCITFGAREVRVMAGEQYTIETVGYGTGVVNCEGVDRW